MVFASAVVLEPKGQTALERLGMAFGNQLVLGSTSFGLGAFGGEQVTEARRAAYELTGRGELEALGHGLFGLLHGEKRRKQRRLRQV